MHDLWDSVLYEFVGTPTLPFAYDTWVKSGAVVKTLVDMYPISSEDAQNIDIEKWA